MTGPPVARTPVPGSAQIREQQIAALKFRSAQVDVFENNRRIDVITQVEARKRLALGGYEAVGNNTIKYIRRVPRLPGPIDGPIMKASSVDNSGRPVLANTGWPARNGWLGLPTGAIQ